MTKEKFVYELIENWLYLISQQCVLMENYTQKDRTATYHECCESLEKCLDYFDQVYKKVDFDLYSEEEIEAVLEFLIQQLRNKTIANMILEIETILCADIGDSDSKKDFMHRYLFLDKEEKQQGITKPALLRFIKELRLYEEGKKHGAQPDSGKN